MRYIKYLFIVLSAISFSCEKTKINDSVFDKIDYPCQNNAIYGQFSLIVDNTTPYCEEFSEWRNFDDSRFGFHEIFFVNGKQTSSVVVFSKKFKKSIGTYDAVILRCDIADFELETGQNSPGKQDYWDGKISIESNGKIKIENVENGKITGKYYFQIPNHIISGSFRNVSD